MTSQPVVHLLRPAVAHGPFNITEQNQPILTAGIFRIVNIGLIKQHPFPIAPAVALAIHLDKAAVIVRRRQAEMKAQRTGVGIAVARQTAAVWQGGEHGRFHRRDIAQ